jgi:hypothetical protein
MSLSMQPVRVPTGQEEEGRLVFHEDRLVAVLIRGKQPTGHTRPGGVRKASGKGC